MSADTIMTTHKLVKFDGSAVRGTILVVRWALSMHETRLQLND